MQMQVGEREIEFTGFTMQNQKQRFVSIFKKDDPVEVTKPNSDDPTCYYPATVIRPPTKHKNLVFVEYLTLFNPCQNPVREYLNVGYVRPKPHENNPISWFKVGDAVDAFRQTKNAWCPGTVTDILENSNYVVSFLGPERDSAVIPQCSLRLHRDWHRGSWVPPLPHQEQSPEIVIESDNQRFKIKYRRRPPPESNFKKGMMVEVSSDDEGYKGAWFVALVVDIIGKDGFLVQYRDITTDDENQLLKEQTDARFMRPCPPEVSFAGPFKQFQEVDAWYNDGWWEGVVLEVLNGRECFVCFCHNDVLKFETSKLRPHQDWFDGKWVMSSKNTSELAKKFGDVVSRAKSLTGNKLILNIRMPREVPKKSKDVKARRTMNTGSKYVSHFCKGEKVEVKSDEEGYQDSWYAAVVVGILQNDKYLVEYLTLKTDDLTEQLKEVADASDIRPYPPEIGHAHHFALRECVDAWYNEGWWIGRVSSVLRGSKYKVYFWSTKEEMEFEHHHLRPHQEWIEGRWVLSS